MKRLAIVSIALVVLAAFAMAAEKTTISESVTIERYNFSKIDKEASAAKEAYGPMMTLLRASSADPSWCPRSRS